jgi:hypothetical protein
MSGTRTELQGGGEEENTGLKRPEVNRHVSSVCQEMRHTQKGPNNRLACVYGTVQPLWKQMSLRRATN